MPAKNQAELVKEMVDQEPPIRKEKIALPGIQVLHQKPKDEIAEVLTTVLKSRANIRSLTYVVGEYIEVTVAN